MLARAGRIDALVNNAGIGGGGPIEDVPVDWAKSLFETNYFGTIRMTQAVLPGMRERRAGAIVDVSSIAGRLAIAGHGHYSAVKHALEAASEVLARRCRLSRSAWPSSSPASSSPPRQRHWDNSFDKYARTQANRIAA